MAVKIFGGVWGISMGGHKVELGYIVRKGTEYFMSSQPRSMILGLTVRNRYHRISDAIAEVSHKPMSL